MHQEIREGTIEDLAQLKELALISYSQFENELTKENWQKLFTKLDSEHSYTDMLKVAKCFICEVENKVIGVAYIIPSGNPTDIFAANWSYIRMVAVNPKYRGHGISKKLTQNCITHAIKIDEEVIALHTSEMMHAARHIYEGLGFKKIKELKPIFGKRYWLYQLKLNKTPSLK